LDPYPYHLIRKGKYSYDQNLPRGGFEKRQRRVLKEKKN
jgi:hypothetical protein